MQAFRDVFFKRFQGFSVYRPARLQGFCFFKFLSYLVGKLSGLKVCELITDN
jgi:hypothetical protein